MRKAWIDPRGWFRYLTWHRQNHPEIIHAHLPHATWFARWVRLLAPVRVVIDTIHTSNTGTAGRRLGYRRSHWLSNHITCVSQSVAQSALTAKMITPDKLTVLPNGVPMPPSIEAAAPYLPASSACRSGMGNFLWIAVGRLAPVKDYPTLLKLQIVGTGPEEANLRALALSLDIHERIQFAGFQTNIQPLLTKADAFVLASLWEGLPISVLEASAAALPVVATDAAGTSESLISGETGILVPIGDSTALAQAMKQIMTLSPQARKKMGDRGRQFIEEKFSLPATTTLWEQLYAQLLAHNPNPTRLP
jgi:glycosyltransferase involved in cell wall biosynthesis